MSDLDLVRDIKTKWGEAIATATENTQVPPALLGGIIANESSGNLDARRFEPGVLTELWEALIGRKPSYGSIGTQTLVSYVSKGHPLSPPASNSGNPVNYILDTLDALANSWSLTQIMGYECFELDIPVPVLQMPDGNLRAAVKRLERFATRFSLEFDADAADLFRCWNTGRPDGKTFDPNYAQKGIARMLLFEQLH